jgi:hypothetical protein
MDSAAPGKPVPIDPADVDVLRLEGKFKEIIGEMTDLQSARKLTAAYEQIHDLTTDAHEKNQKLAKQVQLLNSQVVANATKVATLLAASAEDNRLIDRYRADFERAWKLLAVTQAKESYAKAVCESLKDKVVELSDLVRRQGETETIRDGLSIDVATLTLEPAGRRAEMEELREDMARVHKDRLLEISRMKHLAKTIARVEEDIASREGTVNLIRESGDQLFRDIVSAKVQNNDSVKQSETLVEDIAKLRRTLIVRSQELQQERVLQSDTSKVCDDAKRSLREALLKRDRILAENATIERNILRATNRLNSALMEEDNARLRLQLTDDRLGANTAEMERLAAVSAEISRETNEGRVRGRKASQERTKLHHEKTIAEAKTRTASQVNNTLARNAQLAEVRLAAAHQDTVDARDGQQFRRDVLKATKADIQRRDLHAAAIEREGVEYHANLATIAVHHIRVHDNIVMMKEDMKEAEIMLGRLGGNLTETDRIIRDIRQQRDAKAVLIEELGAANGKLGDELADLMRSVDELKERTRQRTLDCITEHFRTRGMQKVVGALQEVVRMTKQLTLEGRQAIIGYQAEKQKLHLILEEAMKDIQAANAERTNIRDVSDLLGRRLREQEGIARNSTIELETTQKLIRQSGNTYDEQSAQLGDLSHWLASLVHQNKTLTKGSEYIAHLQLEIITLESRIRRETGIRGRVEGEFTVPRNVHRWTLMKVVEPRRFVNIQMTQYLRIKIEKARRTQIMLSDKRKRLAAKVAEKVHKVRTSKITDGQYALVVLNESIGRKDAELAEFQREIDVKRTAILVVEEGINDLKGKLKKSHIAFTTIKRHQHQQFPAVPVLHIKTLERSRLGGGFMLNSDRPQGSRTFLTETTAVLEDEEETRKVKPTVTRISRRPPVAVALDIKPATARPMSNFARISDSGSLDDMIVDSSARSLSRAQSARAEPEQRSKAVKKKPAQRAKPTVSRLEDSLDIRPNTRTEDPGSISRLAQTPRRTKTDRMPIGPYFGPA